MVFAIQKKRNVLMMGLFAVVGFNVSLNPESIEVRRNIASQKVEGKAELASEVESIPMLSVNLSRILEEMTRQREELHVTREARVVRKSDGKDVDYIEVEFKVTNTEGQNPFTCRECAKGWHKVKFSPSIYDRDSTKFQSNVDKKLAQTIDQMRDKERAGAPSRGRPDSPSIARDNCNDVDLGMRLACKSEKLDEILDLCDMGASEEKERRRCINQVANYYRENLADALKQGLNSESEATRSTAASVRNKLFRNLPTTTEIGNNIRVQLVEQTLTGLQTAAQKSFDDALKECRPQVRSAIEQRQCADAKLASFLSSQRSNFGDISLAGETLTKSFNEKMKAWKPTGGPLNQGLNGQSQNIAGQGLRQRVQVQNACPGPKCPRTDRWSVFPTPGGPNGGISQDFKPYTGQPGGGAPGSPFLRPN